VSLGYFAS